MSTSLSELEAHRNGLLQQFTALGDMRRGSVSAFRRRCGRPNCHCAWPKDPGHGPPYRLTHSVSGKTVTETFANQAQRRKAQREVAEFHHFQQCVDTSEGLAVASQGGEGTGFELGVSCARKLGFQLVPIQAG